MNYRLETWLRVLRHGQPFVVWYGFGNGIINAGARGKTKVPFRLWPLFRRFVPAHLWIKQ